jgi:hypothetical protein
MIRAFIESPRMPRRNPRRRIIVSSFLFPETKGLTPGENLFMLPETKT